MCGCRLKVVVSGAGGWRVTEVKRNVSPDQTFLRHLQCSQSLLLRLVLLLELAEE